MKIKCKVSLTIQNVVKYTLRKVSFTNRGGAAMKNLIRDKRLAVGMTQDELSFKLDVSRQTIISLEKGKYNPSITLAFKLSRLFNCSIEELFIYEEEEKHV